MTRAEQLRRFGSVPIPDCALAKAARRHARWQTFWRSAIKLAHGLVMGALLVGAFVAGAYLGG